MDNLQEKQKGLIKNALQRIYNFLGISDNVEDQLIVQQNYKPDEQDHNGFIPKLVVNNDEISLWHRDMYSHSNKWFWRKREFECLEDYIAFRTDYLIHSMAIRKVFQILTEAYADRNKVGFWERLIRDTNASKIEKNRNRILNEIENSLFSEREAYFQSEEFQIIKSDFEKNRKNKTA